MPTETNVEEVIQAWLELPSLIKGLFRRALLFLVSVGLFIGGIMVIWGAIKWSTGYGRRGRDTIIKGVALMILSLAPSLVAL